MRRLAALTITMALAWVLVAYLGDGTASATALALGVTLIAASIVGWLFESAHLPRLTWYLIFGLICGPYMLNIITRPMARYLQLINGLAIAIIATNEHATVFEARLLHADNIGRWQYMCTDSHALIGLATLLRTPHEVRPVVIPASSDERLALVLSTSAARTLAEGYESARDVAV